MSPGSPGLVDVDALVRNAKDLRPLPASAMRLAGLLAGDDWELAEIAGVVALDEALTGRVLGAANSARSGPRAEIASVDHAVMRLGPGFVLAMAVGGAARGPMSAGLPELGLAEGELWRHSVAAALATQEARRFTRLSIPPHAFAAALLHDVGKLVLARHLGAGTRDALRRACSEAGLTPDEAEREVLQVGHAELGALVARSWGLPESIAEGVRFHHNPLSSATEDGRKLCYVIALADAVAHAVGATCGATHAHPAFTPDIAGRLGMTSAAFEELGTLVGAELETVLALYGD